MENQNLNFFSWFRLWVPHSSLFDSGEFHVKMQHMCHSTVSQSMELSRYSGKQNDSTFLLRSSIIIIIIIF